MRVLSYAAAASALALAAANAVPTLRNPTYAEYEPAIRSQQDPYDSLRTPHDASYPGQDLLEDALVAANDPERIRWWSLTNRLQSALGRLERLTASLGIFSAHSQSQQDEGDSENSDILRPDQRVFGPAHHPPLSNGGDDVHAMDPSLPGDSGFPYGSSTKVRGVNIGNWLLFELWMDPTLTAALNNHAVNPPHPNAIVDEWTAGQYSNYSWAEHVLRKHFDTWMTEDDWKQIAAAGLNHVRIPFPYWAFAEINHEPYLTLNRFAKLKEGVLLCKKYGLKVWIDLHGVPGSQNGYDNSGHADGEHWADSADNYSRTQYALNKLISEFSQSTYDGTVTGIQAVNEPHGATNPAILSLTKKYYYWAHNAVAHPNGQSALSNRLLVIHDAFKGLQYWQNFWTGRGRHRVVLDTHPYFVYSDADKKAKDSVRLQEVCNLKGSFVQSEKYYPSVAGEWSVSGPNGDRASDRDLPHGPVRFLPRPDNDPYPFSIKYMAFMRRNFATQQEVYEAGSGWIFWAWKNDGQRDWSYQLGLKYGWIPSDLDDRPYGTNICG